MLYSIIGRGYSTTVLYRAKGQVTVMNKPYERDEQCLKFINMAVAKSDISKSQLAIDAGFGTLQNFQKRLRTGHLSIAEYQRIAEALGCKFEIKFVFPDGKSVEA